jgi:putative thiamine transport system ATP-binding protein
MTEPMRLEAVTIALDDRVLIPPLDCEIAPGTVVTIMGPSGSGKSALLSFIGGFLDRAFIAGGTVKIGAVPITQLAPEQRRVGILFQDDLLFPHLSVGENLAFGLRRDGASRTERRHRIERVLAEAGLDGFFDRDPATLSGGQKARAALLRTLLAAPRALLLDEPFGKLDKTLRQDFRRFVFDHARTRGLPVLLVTHDEDDARAAGGAIVTLSETEPVTRSEHPSR